MKAISCEKLTKFYGQDVGINGVDFDVEEGEIVGFVGQNGAGKSTTIKVLMNLVFPTSGSAKVFDRDVVTESEAVKKLVGYVPSEVIYNKGVRADDVFKTVFSFNDLDYDSARVEQLCGYLELDRRRPVANLSMGNRKKVSVIAALLKRPKLLILDEPTNGLDPLMQEKLFDILQAERRVGMTVFLSSHNLSEVNKYCDRVLVIKGGKIIHSMARADASSGYHAILRLTDNTELNLEFDGSVNDMLSKLIEYDIAAIEIQPKSIENEFKKFYMSHDDKEVFKGL